LRDAQGLHVRVGAELGADGSVINESIHLVDPEEAPDGRTCQLYEAARRSLIRCARYVLPRDKYAEWREIEIAVNPEGVVSVR
jgi:colicin import membrane protein